MTVESAKTGKIALSGSDFAEVRNWSFSKSANVKTYASSSTSGHQKTVKGMFSGTVSFDVVLDPDDTIEDRIKPGDQVTLTLYRNASDSFSVPCRIASLDDEVQIEEGEPPTVSCEAESHGAWTYPDGSTSAG